MKEEKIIKKNLSAIVITAAFIMAFCMMPLTVQAEPEVVTLLVNQTAADDTAERADNAAYKTINGAIAAAQDGDTIALEADFTASGFALDMSAKTLTFDYAGHTVSCGGAAGFKCAGTANLTIIDSSADKTGALVMTKDGSTAGLYVYGTAHVVVKGGYIDGTKCTGNPTSKALAVWNCGVDAYVLLDNGRYGGYVFGNSLQANPLAFVRFTPEQLTNMGDNYLGMINPGWYGYELGEGQIKLTEDLTKLMVIVEKGKNLTIDLNGHNMTSSSYNAYISPGAGLTVKNTGACNDSSGRIYCSKEGASTHNFFNAGTLTLDGKIQIINQMIDKRFAPVYLPEINSCLTVNDGVTIDSTGCTILSTSNAKNSKITINGGVFNGGVTPIQNTAGNLAINGGVFTGKGNAGALMGIFAGDYTKVTGVASVQHIKNAVITARDSGVHIDPGVNENFEISNTTINRASDTAVKYAITNLGDKNIVVSGKNTYFNCESMYQTTSTRGDNTYTGTGSLSITAGIFSVNPSSYVPDGDSDGIKDYAVLDYSNSKVSNYFLVAPWAEVGADNKAEFYYAANAASTTAATDDVSIMAINDTENVVSDTGFVKASHFTISSSKTDNTPIAGLEVTAFKNGNRLTISKQKAVNTTEAYVWYGGKSIGKILTSEKQENVYDVGGQIAGAGEKPTAYLIRNGVKYNATVTGTENPYEYIVHNVPRGIYDLVVSSKINDVAVTMTSLVNVKNSAIAQDVSFGSECFNSILKVQGSSTPKLEVGGLDTIAKTLGDEVTSDNNDSEIKVDIEMIVKQNEASANAVDVNEAIKKDFMINGMTMDVDINKTVTINGVSTEGKITELSTSEYGIEHITAIFHLPESLQGKDEYALFRYHGTGVDKITETENEHGEKIVVNAEKDTIIATLKCFSTYSIAYTKTDSKGGESISAETGDNSHMIIWLILIAASICGLGFSVFYRKNSKTYRNW